MTEWMTDAACTEVEPELFFPDAETGWRITDAAKRICQGCSVRMACLQATPADDKWSIRGGLSARDRARIRSGS